jgi:hypothetical protein
MEAFSREFPVASHDGLANTLSQLVAAHGNRLGGRAGARPSIAVVDWKAAPTRREFEICAQYFEERGHPSRVIEPSELRYEGGRLSAGDFPIDIVYKRVLVGDLARSGGVAHPLVRAVADGAVTCASRFQVHLLSRKELFAFLWDERLKDLFDEEERAIIGRAIPWSRIVEESASFFENGTRVPLFEHIRRSRQHLVLKPTNQYGGKGVVLGWLATQEEWDRTLDAARREPYLVQQRVALPSERFPVLRDGRIALADLYADINPYIWGGTRSDGFGARLAPGELLNVTAGGGSAVPVFVIQES